MKRFICLAALIGLWSVAAQSASPELERPAIQTAAVIGLVANPVQKSIRIQKSKPVQKSTPVQRSTTGRRSTPRRQCTGSTVLARDAGDGLRVFTALFENDHANEMMAQGCVRYFQGCNSCIVRYRDCAQEAKTCTDGSCLEQHCDRHVRCTAKFCTATGHETPSCNARLTRHNCALALFEGDEKDLLEGVPVVRRR